MHSEFQYQFDVKDLLAVDVTVGRVQRLSLIQASDGSVDVSDVLKQNK
jgi:hypothetical protein